MNPYLRSSSADVLQRAHSQLSQLSASTAASAAPAASAQPAPSLQQLMRDDPVRAAAAHAAAALHVADRSMGAQRAQVAPPPPTPPRSEPEEASSPPPPPQSFDDVLANVRVDASAFSGRREALEAQLERSRQLLAEAAALGRGARPLTAAELTAAEAPPPPAAARPEEAASPQPEHAAPAAPPSSELTRAFSQLALQTQLDPKAQLAPEPEPEPELEPVVPADSSLPAHLRRRNVSGIGTSLLSYRDGGAVGEAVGGAAETSSIRTTSSASDWRVEFLRAHYPFPRSFASPPLPRLVCPALLHVASRK